MCLCDFANDDGHCWPAVSTIARKCSKGERTVQAALKWLEANGFCTRHERSGTSTNYTIHPRNSCTPAIPAPPQVSTRTPAKSAPHPRKSRTLTINEPLEPPKETLRSCASDDARELVDDWNSLADELGLSKVAKLTDQRRRHIRTSLKRNTLEEWQSAFRAVRRSAFCQGENRTGWKANFDFLLQPSSFAKLIEGFYDGKVQ